MNRPIKFRVWDGGRKKMHYLGFIMHISGAGLEEHAHESTGAEGPLELMQFTGLHDADGNEIYEGDVVIHLDKTTRRQDGRPYAVEYETDSAGFFPFIAPCHGMRLAAEEYDFRVIGNIYQNPCLLNE